MLDSGQGSEGDLNKNDVGSRFPHSETAPDWGSTTPRHVAKFQIRPSVTKKTVESQINEHSSYVKGRGWQLDQCWAQFSMGSTPAHAATV